MALRPLPQILLSIFALMAICAAMAWGMAYYMQIDFMTAYLATSPGGLIRLPRSRQEAVPIWRSSWQCKPYGCSAFC